ncbi:MULTISPECIES: hypothetical protein [Vibrio]|uniref:Uncharacterized protein n=2 Tax=Vibrio alginolyticus TaxID=663 RepID=A0ABX4XAM3_VIBAL|nr:MULTISPECIES: hypothetical protein [Vibrio]AGV18066.1 hypothetical protein N646_2254 [Vibrio alginolyticus NBRC 15630 = ATCC 17749]AVF71978.1 hypothetical protein AL545_23990 [Vibrio alginolyticus]ELB1087772.1 hypothetical protein [Vibrio alginolyticus]ELB1512156.1 hypothetical protein [Vibrio alginolyticus]ELB1660344.1 hypothetical protein [Vibrio alginolyticus]
MTELTYLSGWRSDLCIKLDVRDNLLADFNRLLFNELPSSKELQQSNQFKFADREAFVFQLKDSFSEKIDEGVSHDSLYGIYVEASQYLRWCDKESEPAFTQSSLEGYMVHLQTRVMLGELKSSTYKNRRANMVTLFSRYLDLPHYYFNNVVIMDNSDRESYESYTQSDLKQLLPFLRRLFNQTYSQFIKNPEAHIQAHKSTPTMIFEWQGREYKLCGGITKMMCAATYLLAYYTYANTTDLFRLKQPNNASISTGETWYTMPAFKRRAFKTIQVEIGEHELEIPKYAMTFFDKLLNASRIISTNEDATLLQTIASRKVQKLQTSRLQSFLKKWVEKHFSFTDQMGRRLRPSISRFRETGCQLTSYHQGEMVNNLMLNNTPNTRKRHYSEGNKLANNGMMQDTMSIREEQVKSRVNTKQAQKNLSIEVLVIEEENKINLPNLSRTSNGGSCAAPFGEKSQKYTKKAQTQGLAKEGERLACADLLGCFGCPDQVIVQSVSDIWCLLSFKSCVEESLFLHLDVSHYKQNFENIILFINQKILPNINKQILRKAETKLDDDGLHPAWDDSESVLSLIPKSPAEVR